MHYSQYYKAYSSFHNSVWLLLVLWTHMSTYAFVYTYIENKSGISEIKKHCMIVMWSSKTPRMSQWDKAELLVTTWRSHIGTIEQRRSTKTEKKKLICAVFLCSPDTEPNESPYADSGHSAPQ